MSYCFHGQVDTSPPAAAAQGHVPLETGSQVEMPAVGRSRSRGLSPPTFLTLCTSPGSGLTHPRCSQEERSGAQDASTQARRLRRKQICKGVFSSRNLPNLFLQLYDCSPPRGRFPSARLPYCTRIIGSLPATAGGRRPVLAPLHLC